MLQLASYAGLRVTARNVTSTTFLETFMILPHEMGTEFRGSTSICTGANESLRGHLLLVALGQQAREHLLQPLHIDGLGQVVIHARRQAAF